MTGMLTQDQVEDLLINVIGVTGMKSWKGSKVQFCCPVHGETNPSCGVNIDYVPSDSFEHYQVFNCFSCGAKGTLSWLLFKSDVGYRSLREAEKFISERYNVEFSYDFENNKIVIRDYEDRYTTHESRVVLPRTKLALYKSGKETFKYLFDRGYTRSEVKEYMIGRDLENDTVTIPVFWEDKSLAGVIGRYIDPRRAKNERYKIYDDFKRGELIFPLDKVEAVDRTLICVESMLDVILLRRWGYPNAVATMGGAISKKQAAQVVSMCDTLMLLYDNDERGIQFKEKTRSLLKKQVDILTPTYYPKEGKDPGEWGEKETNKVIGSMSYFSAIPEFE